MQSSYVPDFRACITPLSAHACPQQGTGEADRELAPAPPRSRIGHFGAPKDELPSAGTPPALADYQASPALVETAFGAVRSAVVEMEHAPRRGPSRTPVAPLQLVYVEVPVAAGEDYRTRLDPEVAAVVARTCEVGPRMPVEPMSAGAGERNCSSTGWPWSTESTSTTSRRRI